MEADINFNIEDYEEDLKQMTNLTKEEFVHVLRRQELNDSRWDSDYEKLWKPPPNHGFLPCTKLTPNYTTSLPLPTSPLLFFSSPSQPSLADSP